ncbi:thioredoxin family protein [Exiguobacterium sp. s193]|uniref:thioredoxin family protein n=1 Tax=Exiguobacterium sp. s193 TaxID=2751207 RepID=UPI001BE7C5AE|nr:thioredoxin family protein [Exiguobacterium sp. s193]
MAEFARLTTIDEVKSWYASPDARFLYVSSPNCSVCESLFPQIEPILLAHPEIRSARVDVADVPEIAGELSIFTAPVLLLFLDGKEMHREARIVPVERFRQRVEQIGAFVKSEAVDSEK